MSNKEYPDNYLNIPLNGRLVLPMNVGVVQKNKGELLGEDCANLTKALAHLFYYRHVPHTVQEDGTFPTNAMVWASFEHYIQKSTHIYFSLNPETNGTVSYMFADDTNVFDMFVVPEFRRQRIASAMVELLIFKNNEPEHVHFLIKSFKGTMNGMAFFDKISCRSNPTEYDKVVYPGAITWDNKPVIKKNKIKHLETQLDAHCVSYQLIDGCVVLNGKFNREALNLVDELYSLYFEGKH